MSKEIAQTVCGKRIAWLVAIVAAFVVFATLGSQFQYAFAASATISSVSASSQTASASIVDYGIGIEATTASYAVASQTTDALRSVTSFRSYTVTVNEPLTVAALTSSQNSDPVPVAYSSLQELSGTFYSLLLETKSIVSLQHVSFTEAPALYSQVTDSGVLSGTSTMTELRAIVRDFGILNATLALFAVLGLNLCASIRGRIHRPSGQGFTPSPRKPRIAERFGAP